MRQTLLFLCLLTASSLLAQSWTPIADLPLGKHHLVTFTLDSKGYAVSGTSASSTTSDDFYEYDPVLDTWTAIADFPGAARSFAIGLAYNGKGYLGFGASTSQVLNDLWQYDNSTNQWTQLTSCPCSGRRHPSLIAGNGKLYMGLGDNGNNDLKDWWEYNINTNSWTQMADLPGPARHHPFHFNAGGEVFAGLGHGGPVVYKDWYKLDTATNSWTAMIQFPGEARVAGTQFDNDGFGYVLSGDGDNHSFMQTGELWRYRPDIDFWQQLTPHPGTSRWAPASFVIDDEIYFFGGYNRSNGQYPVSAYKYDLEAATVNIEEELLAGLSVYPNPANNFIAWEANQNISEVIVLNGIGQKIAFNDGTSNRLDISDWNSGFYFVQFFVNEELAKTEKVVVQK